MHREYGYVPRPTRWPVIDTPLVLSNAHATRIWLLTVRHTGTHYTFRHLERLGFQHGNIDYATKKLHGNNNAPYFLHTHIESTPIMHFVCNDPVVMTMRNPVDVYRSHLNRYPWDEKPFISDGYHAEYILETFELFDKVRDHYDAYVFRVDEQDQEKEVQRLANWLGVKFNYREQSRQINHDGRTRKVNHKIPAEILLLANQYGY